MDRAAVWEFMERFVGMASGAATILTLAVADRAGLLTTLAAAGPVTARDVADAAGLDHRYTTEILSQLAAAGVVDYDPEGRTFLLPPERATVVADDNSPYSMAGWFDMLPTAALFLDDLARSVREGGGVPAAQFPERMVRGVERANAPSTRILLTRRWLPAMPDVVEKLEGGARVADVGCGSGAAALTMAQAYPASEVVGYDLDPRAIERAAGRASEAGLPNVRFEIRSVEDLPVEPGFDLITAFDVVHDLAQPHTALTRIRESLREGGTLLMMEPAVHPRLEDNVEPKAALVYGVSVLYCLTQSLAAGGAGLGAAWGPEEAENLARGAGFTRFRRLPIENPFSAFYDVRP